MRLEDIDQSKIKAVHDLGDGNSVVALRCELNVFAKELIDKALEELRRIHQTRDTIALAHLVAAGLHIYKNALFVSVTVMGRADPVRVHTLALDMHSMHQHQALAELQREIEEFFANHPAGGA